jgi:carbamoyl-phosphate synthase large subunit
MNKPMRALKIVLTAVGCPGATTMISMLRKNGERKINIVGVDMRNDAIGRFMADEFYQVPPASSEDYVPTMLEIVKKESPDLLFPQSSYEVLPLSRHKDEFEELGAPVLVSEPGPIKQCVDKAQMYRALENADVPVPRILYPESLKEFIDGAKQLDYPNKDVCFKPYVSKGARGFRILSEHIDEADILLHERPNNLYMTLDSFVRIFEGANEFPRLLLMEYVKGREFTVDALVDQGEILLGTVKTRDAINTGLAMSFRTVDRPDLEKYSALILRKIPLDFFVNIQFKDDKLLEINPRVSTFVYQDDLILPYLGIKWALQEIDRSTLKKLTNQIDYTRRTIRYYDQAFWNE